MGVSEKGKNFILTSGQKPTFLCSVVNADKTKTFSGMIVGKETNGETTLAVASTSVVLPASGSAEATLQFPAVFQNGTYRYAFTLFDAETKQSLAKEVTLIGVIKGTKRPQILSVVPDKTNYAWGAPLTLTVALDLPKGDTLVSDTLLFDVAMQDRSGKGCAVLAENQTVTQVTETLLLRFPQEGNCVNAITLVLKSQDGNVIDQKVIAVGLPEMKAPAVAAPVIDTDSRAFFQMPRTLVVGVILTTMLFCALGGYFLVLKKRHP